MTEPESEKERRDRVLKELEGKNISHYSVMLSSYASSRTDANKAIFAFSSAAIGFLLSSFEKPILHICIINSLYTLSIVVFVVAVISTLFTYVANAKAFEAYIKNDKEKEHGLNLKTLSYINYISFGFGVVFVAAIGVIKVYG